jgi:thiosulfate dehydrogenase [quinone] large subunit
MKYSKTGLVALVVLRLAIGWHFFYEGMVKVLNPDWTSKAYLLDSGGFLKTMFEWMALNDSVLPVVDFLNAWGLTLIGLSLLLGIFCRAGALAGMLLLLFYYLSHPAFPGIEYLFPTDGSYFIINKTLVELFALFVIFAFPTEQIIGLERFWAAKNKIPE